MVEAMIEGRKEGRIVSNFNFEIHDFEFFFSSLTQRFVETKQNRGNWDLGKQFEKNSPLALQPFTKKHGKLSMGCRWELRSWSPSNFAGPSVSLACAVALSELVLMRLAPLVCGPVTFRRISHLSVLVGAGGPCSWSVSVLQFNIHWLFHLRTCCG